MGSREFGDKLLGAGRVRFLRTLKETCNLTKAAESVDSSAEYMRKMMKRDDEFKAACQNALEEGLDNLEYEVKRRGFDGVEEPVYWQGIEIAKIKKYSDKLAMYYLDAYRGERFKKDTNVNVNHKGGVLLIPANRSMEEWAKENKIVTETSEEVERLGPTGPEAIDV